MSDSKEQNFYVNFSEAGQRHETVQRLLPEERRQSLVQFSTVDHFQEEETSKQTGSTFGENEFNQDFQINEEPETAVASKDGEMFTKSPQLRRSDSRLSIVSQSSAHENANAVNNRASLDTINIKSIATKVKNALVIAKYASSGQVKQEQLKEKERLKKTARKIKVATNMFPKRRLSTISNSSTHQRNLPSAALLFAVRQPVLALARLGEWAQVELVLKNMTKNDERLHLVDNDTGETMLMMACKDNKLVVIERLLELGSPPNVRALDKRTALHYAAEFCFDDVIKVLLSHKADPNLFGGV